MTAPTITYGAVVLYDFPTVGYEYISTEYYAEAGGDTTSTIDATLVQADDYWNGHYIWYITGDNAGLTRRITDFDQGANDLTHDAFPNVTVAGDTFKLSKFTSVEDGNQFAHTTPIFITDQDDLTLTVDVSGGNKACYVSIPGEAGGAVGELGKDTTVYNTICWRYVCGNASIKAKIELLFHDTTTQTVLVETNSTTHKYGTATITTGKVLDHIRLYANAATGAVGYDFIMVCQGIFTFPQFGKLHFGGHVHNTETPVVNRDTDITQNFGTGNVKIDLSGDMDSERTAWKRSGTVTDVNAGDVILETFQRASQINFNWFTCDRGGFKVVLDDFLFTESFDQEYLYSYIIKLSEYSAGTTDNVTFKERFGIE